MHTEELQHWTHDHVFGQDEKRAGEQRTLLVVLVTAVMMVIEISTGLVYQSMALLADGLHMASHTTALGLAVFAYVITRRLATDRRYAFGVGKINSLAGFASAIMLLGFALAMAIESGDRILNPVQIAFDQALVVAALGLLVNGICAWVLISTPHEHGHNGGDAHHTHDHNLRAAYLHVIADAATSLLAIVALLAGKYIGAYWLDPAMGLVGAALVTRWSFGLIQDTSRVLLDSQSGKKHRNQLQRCIEEHTTDRVSDMHVWCIGQNIFAAELVVITDEPRSPDYYKALIPPTLNIVHSNIEIHRCPDH